MSKPLSIPHALAASALLLAHAAAPAQTFTLEGAVIDSRSAANLGVFREAGDVAQLFKAQKALTFGILRAAGVDLDRLPPEVRQRLDRFQTTNLEAFRAFSTGLDLKDQGRYAEARDFFRRAAELDPGFGLASDQQRAMPEVNLGGQVPLRAVVAAAAGTAVDKGKAAYTVDLAHAQAAIQAGQTVVAVAAAPSATTQQQNLSTVVGSYSQNDVNSGGLTQNSVVSVAFEFPGDAGGSTSRAVTSEYRSGEVQIKDGALESVRQTGGFAAVRGGVAAQPSGSLPLADGASTVTWGRWLSAPGNSASVASGGVLRTAPQLGAVDWMAGPATLQMPGSGSVSFTPAGGSLVNVSGTLGVDFLNRSVQVQNLGFTLGAFTYSGLNGSAVYDATTRSGAFAGNYTSGQCSGCQTQQVLASDFAGNFVGRNADGVVFSTSMRTGTGTDKVSGTQVFKH